MCVADVISLFGPFVKFTVEEVGADSSDPAAVSHVPF